MKRIILIAAILNGMSFTAFAQTDTVKGVVVDSVTRSPQAYISVSLTDTATKQPVKGIQSSANGSFELKDVPSGAYQLKISAIGYKTRTIDVRVSLAQPVVDLGNIGLSPLATQLKEVSVTAAKQVVKQEVDRLIYNVQADPDNKAMDMLDMMRKVPLLSVDGSNNIQLKGSGNYKILIDGKESALMVHNPSAILQSMPASNIESIEVITIPPAKYDAEGLAGIINIITKKQKLQGYSFNINSRDDNVLGPATNLDFAVQEGKFGFDMATGYGINGHYPTDFGTTETFLANQSSLVQNGTRLTGSWSDYVVLTFSYEIDSLNLVNVNFDHFTNTFYPAGNEVSDLFSNTGALLQQYDLNTTGYNHPGGTDAGINYQLGFKKSKAQLLTLSYFYNDVETKSFLNNVFSNQVNFNQANYEQSDNSGTKTQTAQIDYVQPVKKVLQIEAGVKGIFRNNFSDFNSDVQNTAGQYIADPAQSDDFKYEQDVYSLYNSYQAKAGDWAVKAGWRFEYTVDNTGTLKNSYHNLIPSVALQHKFSKSSVNFGFTERIQRPGIAQLNPFVNVSNPDFVSTGNPNLKPELNHILELNYIHIDQNTVTSGLSYAFSNNAIQNVSYYAIEAINNKSDTTTVNTYENLGSNRTLNYNFSANLNLTKQFRFNLNGRVSRVWLQGDYNGQNYSNSGYTGNAFAGPSYLFNNGYRLSFNLSYNNGSINLEGRNGYNLSSQLLLSKSFFNKKLSLSMIANNPWLRYKNTNTYTNTPDFMQTSYNQNAYRSFYFSFNFNFNKLKSSIKRTKVSINNDDLKTDE